MSQKPPLWDLNAMDLDGLLQLMPEHDILQKTLSAMAQQQKDQMRRQYEAAFLFGSAHTYTTARTWSDPPCEPLPASEEKPMAEDLPKQDLLLKFLNMTTSSADGEALTAIRKANLLLKSSGWTWDMLLAAKIKIIEDPFKNLGDPTKGQAAAAPPPRRPAPKPASSSAIRLPPVNSTIANNFADCCYCCGVDVPTYHGFLFFPQQFNVMASKNPTIICTTCNTNSHVIIHDKAAMPQHFMPPALPVDASEANNYTGHCYCCGLFISPLAGYLFEPSRFNRSASPGKKPICVSCNHAKHIRIWDSAAAKQPQPQQSYGRAPQPQPAPRKKVKGKYIPGIGEL